MLGLPNILDLTLEVYRTGPPRALLGATIGLALDFQTWRTMVREQGLSDEQAIEVMARMVRCVARG